MSGPLGLAGAGGYKVELQTKVHTKVRNHGKTLLRCYAKRIIDFKVK